MSSTLIFLTVLIGVSICTVEYFLVRLNSKAGLIIPVLAVISIAYLGGYGIALTVAAFLIYLLVSFDVERKQKRVSEMEKMLAKDLD
jgi:hypothetical protein